MPIPIRNLYFMLCYAWDRLEEAKTVPVGIDAVTDIKDLFARILINGTRRCLKEGLDSGYVENEEDIAGIRGRLALSQSIAQGRMVIGRNVCVVDDFTPDTLANQILKTTLWRLSRVDDLDRSLRESIAEVLGRMSMVTVRHHLSRHEFQKVQLHGNNRLYKFLLNVCEIVFKSSLVEQGQGNYLFKDFIDDEHQMRRLFQDFVFNFLRRHQSEFKVSRDRFQWHTTGTSPEARALLPYMETDITLRSATRIIVIDTKFSKRALQTNFGKQSLRSEHLYQLYSYLKNLEQKGHPYTSAEGLLLYPVVDQQVDFTTELPGHRLSIRTIDLRLPVEALSKSLLQLTAGN
jgi:5-methylcytosine-specific restriction enzyme subunit McrC